MLVASEKQLKSPRSNRLSWPSKQCRLTTPFNLKNGNGETKQKRMACLIRKRLAQKNPLYRQRKRNPFLSEEIERMLQLSLRICLIALRNTR